MTLHEARNEIDKIDAELLRLLLERLELSKIIGEIKNKANMPTFDEAREKEVLTNLMAASKDEYEYVEPIFMEILSASKALQEKTK